MFQKANRSKLIHIISWLFIFSLPYLNFIARPEQLIETKFVFLFIPFAFILFLCGFFYLNLLYLAPKFLGKQKWWIYGVAILTGYGMFYLYNIGVFKFIFQPNINKEDLPEIENQEAWRAMARVFFPLMFYTLTLLISNVLFVLSEQRRQAEITRKSEFEKVSAELSMLKLQISPHFLFNTLNNIRWLVRKKSEESEESILKLSEVLRYIIYDVESDHVTVKQEVDHLRNYINLQSLRIQSDAAITFEVDSSAESYHIAPLLFIHFVENAFKYGVDGKNQPEIDIKIDAVENGILFTCRNRIRNPGNSLENEGVGISNVKRRLELLYRNAYQLQILVEDNYFVVELRLRINDN